MSDFDNEDYGSDASSRGSGYDSSDDDGGLLGGGERGEAMKKRTRQAAVDEKKSAKEGGGKEKSVFDFSDGDDEDENEETQTRKKRRGEKAGLGDRRGGAGKRGGRGGMVGYDESSSEDDEDEDKKHSSDDEKDSNQSSSAAAATVVPFHTMLAQLIALVNVDESVGEAYSRLTQAAQKEHDEAERKGQEDGLASQSSVAKGSTSSAQSLPSLLNTTKKGELFALTKALLSLHGVPTLNKDRDELVDLYYTDGLGARAMAAAEKKKVVDSAGTARTNRDGGASSAPAPAGNSSLGLVPSLSQAPPPPLPRAYAIKWEHNKETLYGPFSSAQMQSWRDKGVFAAKKASTRDINAKIRGGPWQDANSIHTF